MLLEKMVEEDPLSEEPEQEGALSPVKSTNMAHLQTQALEMERDHHHFEQMKLVPKALGADGSGVKKRPPQTRRRRRAPSSAWSTRQPSSSA